MSVDYERIEELTRELLAAIGEDPDREGLQDTPRRYAKWWREFIDYEAGKVETAFTLDKNDEMIAVTGMAVASLCEHHLLPFTATVNIAYIPEEKVLGLSKFARIAHRHAHKLQVQERLVQDIAEEIVELTGSKNVAVVIDGEHSCMSLRGIRTKGSMRTSVMLGMFKEKPETRAELFSLIDSGRL